MFNKFNKYLSVGLAVTLLFTATPATASAREFNAVCDTVVEVVETTEETTEVTETKAAEEPGETAEEAAAEETGETAEETVSEESGETAEETVSEETGETAEETVSEETGETAEETVSEETGETAEETVSEETGETADETVSEESGETAEETVSEESGETTEETEEIIPQETVEETEEIVEEDKLLANDYVSTDGFTFTLDYNKCAEITGYTGTATDLVFPAQVKAGSAIYSVKGIANDAFKNNLSLTSVVIPGSYYIGSMSFYGCISLTEVSLGEGISTLGDYAFSGCTSLKSVKVPSTVTATEKCYRTFENCISLETVIYNANSVGGYMFADCKSLKTVKFGDKVSTIGSGAFEHCISLISVNFPASLRVIKNNAFHDCQSLRKAALNEGLLTIEQSAFKDCDGLEEIVIPASVSSLGKSAFENCNGLKAATVKCAQIPEYAFSYCTALADVTFTEKLTFIGRRAFSNCALTEVKFPASLTTIEFDAFSNCDRLTSVELQASVANLGGNIFSSCDSLRTAYVNSSYISDSMFSYCPMLQKVTMGQNVKSIGAKAFTKCKMLSNVIFGSNVTEIGREAFYNCEALVTANICERVVVIGEYAFQYCDSLQAAVIPASVKTIGAGAFSKNKNLMSVALTNGLATIGGSAFADCPKLDSIYIPQSVVTISGTAFANTGLGSGTVYCERNSVADNPDYYPVGTVIAYGKPTVAPVKFGVKGIINGRAVTFNSDTSGATIYYSTTTSNLTTSDKCVANGTTVNFSNFYGTVYAKAYKNGAWSNVARLTLKIPTVNQPTITKAADNKVTIKTSTPDCVIYYTTDGSVPSVNHGTKINASAGSFYITGGTVKAIAVRSCFTNSKTASLKIPTSVSGSVGVPSFGVKGVIGGRSVTFKSATPGSRIYYSTSSTMSSNDKWVENGESVTFENFYGTIYARTFKNGKWSNPSRLILKIPVVNTPQISYEYGGYVTVKTSTPQCTLIYTVDGTTPTPTHGKKIKASSSRIYVGYGKTIKVIAVRSCFTNSAVVSYDR